MKCCIAFTAEGTGGWTDPRISNACCRGNRGTNYKKLANCDKTQCYPKKIGGKVFEATKRHNMYPTCTPQDLSRPESLLGEASGAENAASGKTRRRRFGAGFAKQTGLQKAKKNTVKVANKQVKTAKKAVVKVQESTKITPTALILKYVLEAIPEKWAELRTIIKEVISDPAP